MAGCNINLRQLVLLFLSALREYGAHEYCCPSHENHSHVELWTAVKSMQPWMFLHHYSNGADIEVKNEDGLTPMAYAARAGEFGMVRMFMDLNVTIDPINNEGLTPLFDVVKRGQLAMARMLLEEGANPNVTDGDGLTPIWHAAKNGWTELVRALLDFNAATEARDNRNIGPLALAALSNRHDVATVLLERGANASVLEEVMADPSLRRPLVWWEVSTLESLLAVRAYHRMIGLIRGHIARRLQEEEEARLAEIAAEEARLARLVEEEARLAEEARAAELARAGKDNATGANATEDAEQSEHCEENSSNASLSTAASSEGGSEEPVAAPPVQQHDGQKASQGSAAIAEPVKVAEPAKAKEELAAAPQDQQHARQEAGEEGTATEIVGPKKEPSPSGRAPRGMLRFASENAPGQAQDKEVQAAKEASPYKASWWSSWFH